MIDELKQRLTALGMSEEMAAKAITAVADFTKTKIPDQFHTAIDSVLAGEKPDLGSLGGLLSGLGALFGKK